MARSDVWLSLEQIDYRCDVLNEAPRQVEAVCDALPRCGFDRQLCSAMGATLQTSIRRASLAFMAAQKSARESGGAPVAHEFVDTFALYNRVSSIRAAAVAWKAQRRKINAEYEKRAADASARRPPQSG